MHHVSRLFIKYEACNVTLCFVWHCQGIVALGAFSYLLRKNGTAEAADYYDKLNEGFVDYWMKNASVRDVYR